MKNSHNKANNNINNNSNGLIPNSLKFISSCIKTASSGVRSASASVAASISGDPQALKDQVLYACFERLELGPPSFKHVLLLGYCNGFQVLDVEDAPNVGELVSKRDDPVTFLQIQPQPEKSKDNEGFRSSHPLLLVVACEETKGPGLMPSGRDGLVRNGHNEYQTGNVVYSPTAVRFYSLKSHNYVHVLRFRSPVYMVRCSPRIVAVGLASQIYCFDAVTLESKLSVLTYPVPQPGVQGIEINIGYGPMSVGPRWLAYASNNPLQSNTGRLSPQSLTPPGVSPSTSPSNGNLVARYAKESSKHFAAGLLNLGDKGYKTLSKYYQELVPDASGSPIPSNCSWKVGRATDSDSAGMVVVQDFVSKAVVSQFRAHTSPISALCFDPSGTLLVTASVHGNNINIFRIMPVCSHTGSGNQSYDWSASHVHLYKLHRGITSAVIQDICFSQYSQWVSIVTSRGTCHIFVLSPFGGEAVLQVQNSHTDGPTLLPVLSLPWWSTASFTVNQLSSSPPPPPPPVTLSVVSRVKNNNSGWLNTVSNAASSAAGKMFLPSGAMTAIFHSCIPHDMQPGHAKANSLEHLLVYSPSGHVIQYCLLPSVGGEPGDTASRTSSGSPVHTQDEELRVKVEPLQWWDVCRRADWPEREEYISGITLRKQEAPEMVMEISDSEDNDTRDKESVRSHLYLSNAEVQINSGRLPIWQKSKIYSFTMSPLKINDDILTGNLSRGEIEIEKIPSQEVDIKRKDLLPVFDHFHRVQSNRGNRSFVGSQSSVDSQEAREKFPENAVISHVKFAANASTGSSEHSDVGSLEDSYPSIAKSSIENNGDKGGRSIVTSRVHNQSFTDKDAVSVSSRQPTSDTSNAKDNFSTGSSLSTDITIAKRAQSVNDNEPVEESSNGSSNHSDLSMNALNEEPAHNSLDFEQFFQEGYCKASVSSDCPESTEVVTDADSSNGSPCDREKCEEDGDNDDLLGGVFAFSEEALAIDPKQLAVIQDVDLLTFQLMADLICY